MHSNSREQAMKLTHLQVSKRQDNEQQNIISVASKVLNVHLDAMLNCSFCEHDHAEKDENSFNSAFWTCEFTDAYGKIKKPVSIAVFLLHTPPVFHSRRLPAKVLSSIFTNSQTLSCHGRTQSFFKSMQAPRTLNIWWQGNPQLKYSFC